jgi:hypothetical protein
VQANEVDAQGPEFSERVDEVAETAGESVVAIDEYRIDTTAATVGDEAV